MTSTPLRHSDFRQRISWRDVERSPNFQALLRICLEEDLQPKVKHSPWSNDLTSEICNLHGTGSAQVICRESAVICGIQLPQLLIQTFSCDQIEFHSDFEDGMRCESGHPIGTITGSITQILAIERTLLNFIQRLSGIATRSADFVKILEPHGVGLLDTRKTTPGLRILEKFATACGGSFNHRMGLFDRVLIKDNHLAAAGVGNGNSMISFLTNVKARAAGKLVEVEIDNLEQLEFVIAGGADAVLLDNFSPAEAANAVEYNQNRVILEASGGINQENIFDYAQACPHFISTGAPVHNARWIDIGLDWIN